MKRRTFLPALHMLLIGGLIYAGTALSGGPAAERPRLVVPDYRVAALVEGFVIDHGRQPNRDEVLHMVDSLIDEEVLIHYALELGMDQHSAAQARLAQIADFVEANLHGDEARHPIDAVRDPLPGAAAGSEPSADPEQAAKAAAALELGLHHGDLVVRRILGDSARRLIRAVVLLREPDPRQVEDFLAANAEEFSRPAAWRISQVTVNGFKWNDTEARARELLTRIEGEGLGVDAALALSDEGLLPASLPALGTQALATQFGIDFAEGMATLPAGSWQGPVKSRYGHHLVYVHEYVPARVPPLAEIRIGVEERLQQKLADEWLALRLRELRSEFEIVVPWEQPS
jgi:hypothetical protein